MTQELFSRTVRDMHSQMEDAFSVIQSNYYKEIPTLPCLLIILLGFHTGMLTTGRLYNYGNDITKNNETNKMFSLLTRLDLAH